VGRRQRIVEHEHGRLEKAIDEIAVALRESCNVFKPIANRLDHVKGLFKAGAQQEVCDALDDAQNAYERVVEACRRVEFLRKPLMDLLHQELPSDALQLIDHPDIEKILHDDDYALTLSKIAAKEANPMARLRLWRSIADKLSMAILNCKKKIEALEYRISHGNRDTKAEGAAAKSVLPKVRRSLEVLQLRLKDVCELFYADRRVLLRDIVAISGALDSASPASCSEGKCNKSIIRELDALYEMAGLSGPNSAGRSSQKSRVRAGQCRKQLS